MPTIEVSLNDLDNLVGKKLSRYADDLWEVMDCVKGDVECVENGNLKLEIGSSDRPDLWCVEGVARQIRGFLGLKTGIEDYSSKDSTLKVIVDNKMKGVRPYIACVVVRGVALTDAIIKQLMQQQDKIDSSYGRNRRRTSIGMYDLDLLKFPLRYTFTKPDENPFVPLDFLKEMTPREILREHPKGQEYGRLVSYLKEYPIFLDADGKVLSMPPVINSNTMGKITDKTKNVLVEVTGTDYMSVNNVLTIMAMSLADRGGKLTSVRIAYPYMKGDKTPHFDTRKMRLDADYVNRILGTELKVPEMIRLLKRSRFDASPAGKGVEVTVPFHRVDIMHPVDLIEDITIAYGCGNFKPDEMRLATTGGLSPRERYSNKIRDVMIGSGFQEVMTFTITSRANLFDKMNVREEEAVEIANPVNLELTHLRNWMLPGLMKFFSENKHHTYPQRIFEVGDCVVLDDRSEMKTRNVGKICCAISYDNANLTEIKSHVESLLNGLGIDYGIRAMYHPSFIETRCGMIVVKDKIIGIFGEVHPKVLQSWKLEKPVIAFEIELDKLM